MRLKLGLFCSLMMMLAASHAKEYYPKYCHAMVLDKPLFQLTAQKKQLAYIHNISDADIWLGNLQSPRWTLKLLPGQWSIFYAPKQKASWKCVESRLGHEQQASCHDVIAVCQMGARPPKNDAISINQWLLENQGIVAVDAYLQRMGWQFIKLGSQSSKDVSSIDTK